MQQKLGLNNWRVLMIDIDGEVIKRTPAEQLALVKASAKYRLKEADKGRDIFKEVAYKLGKSKGDIKEECLAFMYGRGNNCPPGLSVDMTIEFLVNKIKKKEG